MSYIIVQPEFSVPVGMRNRLCHELHLCHCNPECDISCPVGENHMAMTGCPLKNNSSVLFPLHPGKKKGKKKSNLPLCSVAAFICRSEAILLNLGYTLHSYCVPCKGRMGQEGMCYVGSLTKKEKRKKRSSALKQNGTDCLRTGLQASCCTLPFPGSVMNSEWHSDTPVSK